MVRIVAWKCRSSGTLFEDKKSFQKHLCTRAFRQHVARKNDALAREGNTRIPLKGKKKHRLWDVELSDMSFRDRDDTRGSHRSQEYGLGQNSR